MSSTALLRQAVRGSAAAAAALGRASLVRPAAVGRPLMTVAGRRRPDAAQFSTSVPRRSGHEETFDEFTARYEKEFDNVHDSFELQRNLNNSFAYDLVPSPSVVAAALRAARRVNDFPTAVRVFEGLKAKVENKDQYQQYLDELKDIREELGIPLVEDMYPELHKK